MGRFPRKCKLRGPSRVTSGYPPGTLPVPCTFRRGLIWKIRQKSGKIWAKSSENLSNLATERRISMANSGDIKHGGEMTSYKRSLDLQLVLFSLHFSPYPLRARELGNYSTRRERGGEGSHGDRFGLYGPPRKTPLYRGKHRSQIPFLIFIFSIFQSCRAAIGWNMKHVNFIEIERFRH